MVKVLLVLATAFSISLGSFCRCLIRYNSFSRWRHRSSELWKFRREHL